MTRLFPSARTGLGAVLILAAAAAAQGPLTLAEAMRTVREQGSDARLLNEKETKLQAQKSEAWAGALPNVSAYANVGRGAQPFDPAIAKTLAAFFPVDTAGGGGTPPSDANTDPASTRYSYGVQVTQPLFAFGRVGQAIKIAGTAVKSQSEANRRSRQELDLQTLDAFYGVLIARAKVDVLEASQKRQGETSAFLQSNFKGGAGDRATVLLAQASFKALEPQRIRAERDADASRMALNRLLDRPIESALDLDSTSIPDYSVPNGDTSEAAMTSVVENRPDLSALHYQRETLHGFATEYRMQYLPSIAFQGKWGILAYKPNEQLTDFNNNLDWQVGVGMQWTLFDGMAMSSKARQYDSDARTMAITERQATAYARIEIESARREVDASDTAYEAARQSRDASAEARTLLSQNFRAGGGQITDLLAAEEGLRNAELGLLAARYQKTRARAALRVALGMNLTEEGSK